MRTVIALLMFVLVAPALGHGGEDHGAPAPPPVQDIPPRAVAATDEFELVAVPEGTKLVLYLDRFASNEPVTKAKVEIDGAGINGVASETAPGVYVLKLAAPLAAAKHAMSISVESAESSDLLAATLDTSLPLAAEPHQHGWSEWAVWIAAGVVLAGIALLFVIRNRRQSRNGHAASQH